jgi:arylsulfatase A-like enzyme
VVDVLGRHGPRPPFPGRSLVAADAAEDLALSELDLQDHSRSTRPGQWHSPAAYGPMQALVRDGLAYIHNGNDREELYDVARDPNDQHDLAGRPESRPALERFRRDLKGVMPPR